jgi:hypothetical protein
MSPALVSHAGQPLKKLQQQEKYGHSQNGDYRNLQHAQC